jgi:hypothetical protein
MSFVVLSFPSMYEKVLGLGPLRCSPLHSGARNLAFRILKDYVSDVVKAMPLSLISMGARALKF